MLKQLYCSDKPKVGSIQMEPSDMNCWRIDEVLERKNVRAGYDRHGVAVRVPVYTVRCTQVTQNWDNDGKWEPK